MSLQSKTLTSCFYLSECTNFDEQVKAGSLTWVAAAVQELWRRRVYNRPGRAGSWSSVDVGIHGADWLSA